VDRVYIKSLIQSILDKEFKNSEKRRIHEYHDRLNFACPICQDSKDNRKKRGNLYFNRLILVCFNCGAKVSLDRVCKQFSQPIDADKKLEITEYLNSQIQVNDYQNDIDEFEFQNLHSLTDIERIFKEKDFSISDFSPVNTGSTVARYLADRGIAGDMLKNIYQAKWWYTETRYENIICFLNRKEDKILSIQIRNLKPGKKRMFKIFNWETLWKWINGRDEVDSVDINQLVILNKLSYYFNLLNIDFDQPITVFEGFLDSLFFPNSIGIIGVNTSLSFLENNSGLQLRYFFDNDYAGNLKTEQKLKAGYPCFIWNKLFDTIVKSKSNVDPYKLMYRISKVKDLNDLDTLVPKSYYKLKLENYFSIDGYDLSWVPKTKKKKANYTNKYSL
jgi:hypothetical protein